jgi:hypothetical protein
MTKAELLADLSSLYKSIGTPIDQGTSCNNVHQFLVYVFEEGLSEGNKKPTGCQKMVVFYVYNEGIAGEAAYYELSEPLNTSNTDVSTAVNSGYSYHKIYISTELRNRVWGFIIKGVDAVIHEDAGTVDHAKRLKWAYDCSKDSILYLNAFMIQIANNGNVRTQGNSIIDGDLEWIVNSEIGTIATAYGFTN